MKKYKVFFELYGHKMKTTVTSYDTQSAKQAVADSLHFFKVIEILEPEEDTPPPTIKADPMNFLRHMFGITH